MTVAILDYGMGNLGSVMGALEICGAEALLCSGADALAQADKVILPGVGAFADGMAALRERGLDRALIDYVASDQGDVLGICLGMQLFADKGHEGRPCQGLGLIPGEVTRIEPQEGERVPHVGWNSVNQVADWALWSGIADGSDFYFVHSYHFVPRDAATVKATTPQGGGVVAALSHGRVHGVQFHPEKSSHLGRRLLANFLAL